MQFLNDFNVLKFSNKLYVDQQKLKLKFVDYFII